MSHVMRKPDFCLCENKGADQLRSNCEADQRLCFRYTDSACTITLLPECEISKFLAIFCSCTCRFVYDQVGNPKEQFSRDTAHTFHKTNKSYAFCHKRKAKLLSYLLDLFQINWYTNYLSNSVNHFLLYSFLHTNVWLLTRHTLAIWFIMV